MAGGPPDLSPFFQAVIQHLAVSPGGATFIAKLGLDPIIKSAWLALNMSKSKKMAAIIDTRPDLFSRYMTERAQPMVKLEPRGYECLATGEIPPLGLDAGLAATVISRASPALAAVAASSSSSCAGQPGAAVAALPSSTANLSPQDARKLFLRHVLDAVAAKDGCVMDLPQLGSVPEVQQAWKVSGLDKRLKMSDVLKERPDLVMVSVGENGSAMVALTQKAILCVQAEEVPDPDESCPPPVQATKKKGNPHHRPGAGGPYRGYGGGPKGGCGGGYGGGYRGGYKGGGPGGYYSSHRYDPYSSGGPKGGMQHQGYGPPATFGGPQYWPQQHPLW
mmetsp:Transcript_50421/g.150774  ORF Transcript_50421/g.150774 Transcript_50421/m.150774 type:complete len:334 (-) Transcript_50421:122-1123(-)|eukprot:CAMPEP_0175251586 /NCGR_PEP_ID=MMETSP0093-20121207/35738_1 /TAXON_ID=311494 /ORGANISM="Alexandrium monilatum, Strain CCMP3105" /LENGTH=333 /DNA_ID=CAMNT_0016545853 /DNA_START=73 /DNA_END=1074 /DNA_ORIENTATION=-